MDDKSIIELYFKRNEDAIKQTEAKYGKLCYGIAFNVLGNKEDAEECVNDAYAGVWRAIPPTKPNNLMAFVSRITRNVSLKRLEYLTRDKRCNNIKVSLDELEAVLPDERLVEDENIVKLINDFLLSQKADARNIFIRRYYFFDSLSDIAKRYAFTESKVKSILFRTRSKLRDYLIKEGVYI